MFYSGPFAVFAVIYSTFALFGGVLGIVCYVFHSLGLYTIAKRRGISNYGLAWVPIANVWILGSISDNFDFAATGIRKKGRQLLLWLSIALLILSIICTCLVVVVSVNAYNTYDQNSDAQANESEISYVQLDRDYYDYDDDNYDDSYEHYFTQNGAALFGAAIPLIIFGLLTFILSIVLVVFEFIAYYKLYKSCNPDLAVVFTVLSVIFSVTIPFFVFALRNKDNGMPISPYNEQYQQSYTQV